MRGRAFARLGVGGVSAIKKCAAGAGNTSGRGSNMTSPQSFWYPYCTQNAGFVSTIQNVHNPQAAKRFAPSPSEQTGSRHGLRTERGRAVGAAPLERVTDSVSPSPYGLLDGVTEMLPRERVADCSKHPVPGRQGMEVRYNPVTGRASYGGLAVCGDIWRCPVCSGRELAKRRAVLRAAGARAEARGWGVVLVTVTLQHAPGDDLGGLTDTLTEGWRKVAAGKAWGVARERWGILEVVTALEVRLGAMGWHPHKHALLILDHRPSEAELAELEAWLSERFSRYIAAAGGYSSPTWGVQVSGHGGVEAYLAKWTGAEELTVAAVKRGTSVTPWALVAAAMEGDRRARAFWLEYAAAMPGRRQMTGLKGFCDLVGLTAEDVEAVEAGADGEGEGEGSAPLLSLTRRQWAAVVKARKRAELLAVAEATGSAEAVWAYLVHVLGIPTGGGS